MPAGSDDALRIERELQLAGDVPKNCVGRSQLIHCLDAHAIGYEALLLAGLEQSEIALLGALHGFRIIAIEDQRDRAIEAAIGKAFDSKLYTAHTLSKPIHSEPNQSQSTIAFRLPIPPMTEHTSGSNERLRP